MKQCNVNISVILSLVIGLLMVLLMWVPEISSAETLLEPESEDRVAGEGNRIQKRHDWFFSTRYQGATKNLREMRKTALSSTKKRYEKMRSAFDRNTSRNTNVWLAKGPASSKFGSWTFGNVSGRIISLAKDWQNNYLYVGAASGGLWRSADDGQNWESLSDSVGSGAIGAIALDPNAPTTIWIGTGENSMYCEEYFGIGLLRSIDGGMTWEMRNGTGLLTLENLSAFASIIVDPRDSDHIIVGGRYSDCVNGNYYYGGIYSTNDGGLTWYKRLSGGIDEIVQDPVNKNVYWAGTQDNGLYKSIDNGLTWTLQSASSLPTGYVGRTEVAVSPSNPDYVYVLFASVSGTSQFWQSTNGGISWTQKSTGSQACDGQCSYNMVLRVHMTNPTTVYRGTIRIFRSTNGGSSWTDLSNQWGSSQKVHQDTHTFLMDPFNVSTFYVGCDGGIWKTEDGGSSFINLNSNLNLTQFYAIGIHPTDNDVILGGSQDNSSLARTTDDIWQVQSVTGDGFVCHINPGDTDYVYIASYPSTYLFSDVPSIYRSTNGVFGSFWHISNTLTGISGGDRSNWVTPYTIDPTNPDILYLGTHRIYKSTNKGGQWDQVGPSDMTNGFGTILSIEVSSANGSYVYAGTTDGNIWYSSNGGLSWTDISSGLPARSINDIAANPDLPGHALCVVGGFNSPHLYEFSGAGSWKSKGTGLPNVPTNTVIMRSSADIIVGNDVGLFRSEDSGSSFDVFMDGFPLGIVAMDLKYSDNTQTLTAGTYGRGAWQYTFDETQQVPSLHWIHAVVLVVLISFFFFYGRKKAKTSLR